MAKWFDVVKWFNVSKSGEKWRKVDKSGDFMWLSGFMWLNGLCGEKSEKKWEKVGKGEKKW